MTSPYRDAAGIPCPRCRAILAPDTRGDLVCADGCGTWVPRAAIVELVGEVVLESGRAVPYWKYEPFPATLCIRCSRPLADLCVHSEGAILVFGQCAEHGVWLERGTRLQLERGYADQIAAFERSERLRTPGTEGQREASERIEQLERDNAKLHERIAWLEGRVSSLEGRTK